MVTVKHINNLGEEFVIPAKSIALVHTKTLSGAINSDEMELIIYLPDGDTTTFREGTFYVMNEYGRTIADYHPYHFSRVPQGTVKSVEPKE